MKKRVTVKNHTIYVNRVAEKSMTIVLLLYKNTMIYQNKKKQIMMIHTAVDYFCLMIGLGYEI